MIMENLESNVSSPVISIRNLYKSFAENEILKGVDIDLFKGENLVVLGRSGSGKSVLIKLISGLLSPDRGSIKVLDREVPELNNKQLQELRLKIGFSFQSSALYDSMSVKENLEFPLIRNSKNLTKKQVDSAVSEALEAVGLTKTLNQMPSELSGGQRKRIGIARTLIMRPEIMLYDEPTAGLDPITCIGINDLINQVKSQFNTSSIIITHDLTCAKHIGNRVAMLLDGSFLKIGSFDDVFDSDNEQIKGFFDYNFIN
jgi:phospholipid/cholesterol/gamma-HCH transport system ATP-binding protein